MVMVMVMEMVLVMAAYPIVVKSIRILALHNLNILFSEFERGTLKVDVATGTIR